MSGFETACWNWYAENVSGFTSEHGLVPLLFGRLKFGTKKKKNNIQLQSMFLKAMNMIHHAYAVVHAEQMKAAREQARG